jgi:hypothetical protein
MLAPRLWTLDRFGIATKKLKIHKKKQEKKAQHRAPSVGGRYLLPPATLGVSGLSHLLRSSHHLDKIQPLLQTSLRSLE